MAQKLRKTALMFGQTEQKPPETLSGFYTGVGAGQTEAVKTLGQKTEEETKGLTGKLGLTSTVADDGKVTTGLAKDSAFKPAVDTTKFAPPPPAAPAPGAPAPKKPEEMTESELNAAITSAGGDLEAWKKSGKDAETYLDELLADKRKAAGEAATAAQERVTEGKLGQRVTAPSELEKRAQSYQNILATTPGTTNIAAVKNLMQFYDMTKYGALESGLRQGETALARQEAIGNVEAMQAAEGRRAGAVQEYSKQAKELGGILQDEVNKAGEAERKRLKSFYEGKVGEAEKGKGELETQLKTKVETREKKEKEDFEGVGNEIIGANAVSGITGIIDAISGRAGDNWLRNRGGEVLGPLKEKARTLEDDAKQVAANPLISMPEKTKRLRDIKNKIDNVKNQVAGELAAFLGDTNTRPGDALDAAEQIMAAGLINNLSQDQKNTILRRIESDLHFEEKDSNNLSSPEKLMNIYKAFGGTRDLSPDIMKKQIGSSIGPGFQLNIGYGR